MSLACQWLRYERRKGRGERGTGALLPLRCQRRRPRHGFGHSVAIGVRVQFEPLTFTVPTTTPAFKKASVTPCGARPRDRASHGLMLSARHHPHPDPLLEPRGALLHTCTAPKAGKADQTLAIVYCTQGLLACTAPKGGSRPTPYCTTASKAGKAGQDGTYVGSPPNCTRLVCGTGMHGPAAPREQRQHGVGMVSAWRPHGASNVTAPQVSAWFCKKLWFCKTLGQHVASRAWCQHRMVWDEHGVGQA